MRLMLLLVVFLLTSQAAYATTNITVGNITIVVPTIKINVSRIENIQLPNSTVKVQPLISLRNFSFSNLLKDQLNGVYDIVSDALSISIRKSLEQLPTLVDFIGNGATHS